MHRAGVVFEAFVGLGDGVVNRGHAGGAAEGFGQGQAALLIRERLGVSALQEQDASDVEGPDREARSVAGAFLDGEGALIPIERLS